MPDVFWDFFWCNRHLLHRIPAIAASVLQDLAKKKKLIVAENSQKFKIVYNTPEAMR